jgi:glutathione synthase/RimK-type ligase-like ATP-grasp enzyme
VTSDGIAEAQALHARGELDRAKALLLDALQADAHDLDAMLLLAAVLAGAGLRDDARRVAEEAVRVYPDSARAHVALGDARIDADDALGACAAYTGAIELDPALAGAHLGYAEALLRCGEIERSEAARHAGLRLQPIEVLPYRGVAPPIRLLLLASADGSNTGTHRFRDDTVIATTTAIVEYVDPGRPLPPHDVIFNAISDADRGRDALRIATHLVAQSSAPVLNHPARVSATGRAENARRLGAIDGVIAPRTLPFARADLSGPDGAAILASAGFTFPLLLRAPGFHTGQHFVKVDAAGDLAAAAAELPGDHLLAIEFLDARDADGKHRKYRVMFIGGHLYPLHAAISARWLTHYFSADTANDPQLRAEEAAFLSDPERTLGRHAFAALHAIETTLGLDYAGIDFGIADGNILLYEANATMILPPPDYHIHSAYRITAIERAVDAAARLLRDAAHGRRPPA